jgi:RHS repeat-associated protein
LQVAPHKRSRSFFIKQLTSKKSAENVHSTQAFGTTSYQATDKTIKASAKRYRYTGMERDEETGLSYHNARYYIPWLGRWLNADPIGIGDGVNVYAYCGNNPVTHTDSSGTQIDKSEYTRQDNLKGSLPKDIKFVTKEQKEVAKQKIEANKQKQMAALLAKTGPRQDKLIGTADPEYWMTKNNYNPEMAHLVATKNAAQKEGGVMAGLIWAGYALDKVGEYGSAAVAAKSTSGNKAINLQEHRTTNFKAPIEPSGTQTYLPKTKPSQGTNLNAEPVGQTTKVSKKVDPGTKAGLTGEIEAGKTLKKFGYDVELNPKVQFTTKKPDLKIEGKIFDVYTPNSEKDVRGIWSEVAKKIDKGQTERVVLNLKDWKGDFSQLQKQFSDYQISGLKEVKIINFNHIYSLNLK